MSKFKLQFEDQVKDFLVTRQGKNLRIELDGEAVNCRLQQLDEACFILELIEADGSRRRIHAAGSVDGEARQLWVNGRMARYHRVRQQRGRSGNDGSLAATIPAIVTQILVTPGDLVSAGDKLVLLESMKMIIPIQAPYAGRVTAINCAEGDSVQAGVQLIELVGVET